MSAIDISTIQISVRLYGDGSYQAQLEINGHPSSRAVRVPSIVGAIVMGTLDHLSNLKAFYRAVAQEQKQDAKLSAAHCNACWVEMLEFTPATQFCTACRDLTCPPAPLRMPTCSGYSGAEHLAMLMTWNMRRGARGVAECEVCDCVKSPRFGTDAPWSDAIRPGDIKVIEDGKIVYRRPKP